MPGFHNALRRLIAAKKMIGELPEISEYSATGNPATFTTNLSRALTKFEIPFLASQAGSGDPSPDNVRELYGMTGVAIIHNSQVIMADWEDDAGTLYGGVLDAATGLMTVTQKMYTLTGADSEGWTYLGASLGRYRFYSKEGANGATPGIDYGANKTSVVAADYLVAAPNGTSASYSEYAGSIITGGTGGDNVVVAVTFATTVAELKAYLAEHPLHIIGILKTPEIIQVPATEVRTVVGSNEISTATLATNTIKYLKRG